MNTRIEQMALEVRAGSDPPLGMPPARFLRDYWQKRPLLIRGAFADFENPVTPDDLAGLACEELALARIAVHEPRLDRWTLRSGPFVESDFATLPKSHWTLLVQDVDKWDADVAALLDTFAFLPSWRIDDVMVSYAEDGGSVGAHVDQYDVFLLQGSGQRRWQISTDAQAPTAFQNDVELKLLREFSPTHDWLLETGDMLYLPPGVPHHGIAVGACMTYSIGMRAPSQAEMLGDFVDHLLEKIPEEARFVDADLLPSRGDGEIDDAALSRAIKAMPGLRFSSSVDRNSKSSGVWTPPFAGMTNDMGKPSIPTSAVRIWFGCFITRYRSAQFAAAAARPLGDAAFSHALSRNARVQRNPWSRTAWMREARGANLFVAGETYRCTLRLARLVGAREGFCFAQVPSGDLPVMRTLIDAGHLAIVRAPTLRRSK